MGISVKEAAKRLGVNTARIRALIRAGVLIAEKVGGRWLVDEASARSQTTGRPAGRPFSRARAWGLLMLASELPAPWLSRSDRSKLRRRLRETNLLDLAPRLRKRADIQIFRAHTSDLKRIARDGRTVLTGANAAVTHGQNLLAGDSLDVYIREEDLRRLQRDYNLDPASRGNITMRVIDAPWPFAEDDAPAPKLVVAIDLLLSEDQRSQRSGDSMLAQAGS